MNSKTSGPHSVSVFLSQIQLVRVVGMQRKLVASKVTLGITLLDAGIWENGGV
jgi:hypothetical protein